MAEEKEKASEKAREVQPRAPEVKDQLSEDDLDQASGGHLPDLDAGSN
jgi:hypothetical protein